MKCDLCGNDHEELGNVCQFRAATSAELFEALGFSPKEAQMHERAVNATLRRADMKIVNETSDEASK